MAAIEPLREKRRKLLVDDKVEVRSTDDGFLGSWHPGTIISCVDLERLVQFDELLCDDRSAFLTELVRVTPEIEGADDSKTEIQNNYRGVIRPSAPSCDFGRWTLHYGQCVDFFYLGAWWEGVIFDHNDGSHKRRIFFPDMGDEMIVRISLLRISQDWNEVTELWKPRGNWLMLELIEEVEKSWPLPVSAQQIWYSLRMESGFEMLGDWTCSLRNVWRELLMPVLCENLRVCAEHQFKELKSSWDSAKLRNPVPKFSPSAFHEYLKKVGLFSDPPVIAPVTDTSKVDGEEVQPSNLKNKRRSLVRDDRVDLKTISTTSSNERAEKPSSCKISSTEDEKLPSCADSNLPRTDCNTSRHRVGYAWKAVVPDLIERAEFCPEAVKKCIESTKLHKKVPRDLTTNCRKHLLYMKWKVDYFIDTTMRFRYTSPDGEFFYSLRQVFLNFERIHPNARPEIFSPTMNAGASPEKVSFMHDKIETSLHETRGISVSNQLAQSSVSEVSNSRIGRKRRNPDGSYHATGSRTDNTRRKSLRIRGATVLRTDNKRRKSLRIRGATVTGSSTPGQRSSKRVCQTLTSSSQQIAPRTVLSWLIDENAILPRAKVRYCYQKDDRPIAEGRIAREGIKCSCCGDIFSLTDFEAHAGSITHKPLRNIVLEDGSSLLDCLLQLKRAKSSPPSESGSREEKGVENDYMCSVCHFGGDLILCDRCPSSFHTHCVGLKEVPGGDWFCPSCCCGICLHGLVDKFELQLTGSSPLICTQCERIYHVECLKDKGVAHLNRNHNGYWFCQDSCEQIFQVLHESIGKPVPIKGGDLTWRLVKFIQRDSSDHGAPDEYLMDIYGKLNVALSVMHECFEPVKEPGTKDLVEDVLFSRWSELNRLNFQGFYSVLLERKDELISTAAVRIYGKRVAEVPLVATRFQYRGQGMCRILMTELEKKLMEVGVQRLVLPSIQFALKTWTNSFGFSVMNESERLQFVQHTFLDFPGTVFCHKVLTSSVSSRSTGTLERRSSLVNEHDKVELDETVMGSAESYAEQKEITQCLSSSPDKDRSPQSAITLMDQPKLPTRISLSRGKRRH